MNRLSTSQESVPQTQPRFDAIASQTNRNCDSLQTLNERLQKVVERLAGSQPEPAPTASTNAKLPPASINCVAMHFETFASDTMLMLERAHRYLDRLESL